MEGTNHRDNRDEPQSPKPRKSRKGLTLEQRRKISEGIKARWRDPHYRAKVLNAIRAGRKKAKAVSKEQRDGAQTFTN